MTSLSILRDKSWSIWGEQGGECMRKSKGEGEGGGERPGGFLSVHRVGIRWPFGTGGEMKADDNPCGWHGLSRPAEAPEP